MKRIVLLMCSAVALGVFGGASESALWPTERKKVVYLGRDINSVGTADLLRNADAIERSGIDGIGMVLGVNDAYETIFRRQSQGGVPQDLEVADAA